LKTNAYQKDDEFSKKVTEFFSVQLLDNLSFFLPAFICEFFHLSIFNANSMDYFSKLTLRLIEERKKNKDIKYNDFVELLIKSQVDGEVVKQQEEDGHINRELSTEEIVGQCVVFFLAGMETVSGTLVHCLLELALNEKIQDKLNEELVRIYADGKVVDYEDVFKCEYLNAVIDETIRKYPGVNRQFRICLQDTNFGDFIVKKNQVVGASIYNLHHNPILFPEPEKFKPERFLNGEVDPTCVYTFGGGGRHCIAQRFALLEMKSLLINLIKRFRVKTNENTMKFKHKNILFVNLTEDLRLKLERRN